MNATRTMGLVDRLRNGGQGDLADMAADLVEALQGCLAMLERADCSTGYCCCGSSIDGHGIGDGHGPVDEGDYHQLNAMDAARAAIEKAKP